MSFKLYISNRLDELQAELSQNLKKQTTTNVFYKDVLITQTEGMNRWLSIELADSLEIFANAEFHKPNGFISAIFRLADVVESKDFSTEKLRWVLYKLLNDPEFITSFDLVAQYYADDDIKRLQLATRVSDLFDQYLIYRPDFIQSWNKNEPAEIVREKYKYHQEWQSWLWRKLQKQVDFEDKVELRNRLVQQLENPVFIEKLKNRYPKVSLIGLSVLTPFHLEIFSWMSQYIEVNFYQLNPSPEYYWYDQTGEKSIAKIEKFTKKIADELLLETGNTLLSNWGKIGKDAFASLFAHDEVLNIVDSTQSIAPQTKTLLGKLQSSVYHNDQNKLADVSEEVILDGSLQISSCYTPVREVEVFYNYLLDLIDNQEEIAPRDVLILVNDINLYAPFIKAVFDNSPIKIPYSIADRSFVGGDTISTVLDILLKLSVDEFTSENIIQLLDFDVVKNKFGITDIELIRRVMNDANIRYGIAGDKEEQTDLVSWKHGLERIILGYAIKGGGEYFTDREQSTYPIDTVEGNSVYELLRFKAFADAVIAVVEQRQKARSLAEWRVYIEQFILNSLVEVNDQVIEEYHVITEHLTLLEEVSPELEDVTFEVFQKAFLDSLVNNVHSGNFITGRVTFCSMIPMRSIPFKVIALLGMNNEAFPRKDNKLGFNLLEDEKRRGDREVKESDKYLFLESLLSAEQYFYLSYIGKNIKDNASLSPSILIDELLDFIEQSYQGSADHLISEHPLHGFNSQYFDDKNKLFTYFGDKQQNDTNSEPEQSLSPIEFDFSEIHLGQLVSFYKDPVKWYFNKVLGIYYNDDSKLLAENELFELNNLEQYAIRKELFECQKNEVNDYTQKAVANGKLPLKNMANVETTKLYDEIEILKANFEQITNNQVKQSSDLNVLSCNGSTLAAHLDTIYGDQQLIVCYSKQKSFTKYVLEAWFKHLYLIASGKQINTVFLIRERKDAFVFESTIMSKNDAQLILNDLVEYYKQGHQKPLPFLPTWSCKSYLKEFDEKKVKQDLENELKYNEYLMLLDEEKYFEPSQFDLQLFTDLAQLVFERFAKELTKQDLGVKY